MMTAGQRGSRRRRAQRQTEERRNTLSTATRVGRYNLQCKKQWQSLKAKVAGAFMAMSLYTAPLQAAEAAEATGIQRDGAEAPLEAANNVYNILAEENNGSIAMNRFASFDLPSGQIANMYFHTKDQTSANDAAALVNFVQNDINIAGTVNAIKNNAIGGKLFFVTPKNLVVSGSGVINAGAITMIAGEKYPDREKYPEDKVMELAGKITKADYTLSEKQGSIKIAGQLNAPDYIGLVSSKTILLQTGAKLQTSYGKNEVGEANTSFNFADLVNIKNADGTTMVDSGLRGDLTLTRSEGEGSKGNIMLSANATERNHNSEAIQGWMDIAVDNTVRAEITAQAGTAIDAAGEVSLVASAYRANTDIGTYITFGDAAGLEAEINLSGAVTGSRVSVDAFTSGTYKKGIWEKLGGLVKGAIKKKLNAALGNIGDADLIFLGSRAKSTVNYGSSARITATGEDTLDEKGEISKYALDTRAVSSILLRTCANASNAGKEDGKNLGGVAFLYTYAENDAKIQVENGAQLKATAGSIENMTQAITDVDTVSASVGKETATGADKFAAAVNVTLGKTNALIDMQEGSVLQAQNNINVEANADSGQSASAEIKANDSTFVSTAIQVMNMDSSVIVNASGSLEATEGDLAIEAQDSTAINASASNAVADTQGKPSYLDQFSGYVAKTAKKKVVDTALETIKNIVTNQSMGNPPAAAAPAVPAVPTSDKNIPDTAFSAGAAVNVALGTHEGTVNIGEKASLKAGGDMNINASHILADYNFVTTGASSASNESATINSAIGFSKLTDSSAINIAGGTAADGGHSVLTAGGTLALDSASTYRWNRDDALVAGLSEKLDILLRNFTDIWGVVSGKEKLKSLDEALKAYQSNPSLENRKNITMVLNKEDMGDNINTLLKSALKSPSDLIALIRAAEDFLNATSYVNVNVGSVSKQSEQDAHAQAKVNFAAAAVVTDFNTTSTINVGKNAELTAEKDLKVTAKADQLDVNYYGALQGVVEVFEDKLPEKAKKYLEGFEIDLTLLPAWSSGDKALGGNLSWNTNDLSAAVVVAEGAKLTGSSVTLDADADRKTIDVTLGGGSGNDTGVTGMFAITRGTTNSLVVVDDEAILNATNEGTPESRGVKLNADNDSLVVDVVGDLTKSDSKAVGVSMGYVTNDTNAIAAVADNDKGATRADTDEVSGLNSLLNKLLTEKQQSTLGSAAVDLRDSALITAPELAINATSTPIIWNFAVAAGVATNSSGGSTTDAGAITIQNMAGDTAALLEGHKVTLTDGTSRAVSLSAYEDGLVVAPAGALSLKYGGGTNGNALSIAGTSSVTNVNKAVVSQIKDSTITDAAAVNNTATQEETLVTAAVPVNVDTSTSTQKGFSGALNESNSLVTNRVHANLINNIVQQTAGFAVNTAIQNAAYDSSAQITGGINLDLAKTTVGLGVNVAYANLTNDVSAKVVGGSYSNIGSFDNEAVTALTQVTVGVGVGVGSGDTSKAAAEAVGAHGTVTNNANASVDNVNIEAETLDNKAYDGEKAATSETTATRRADIKTDFGIDVDGSATEALLSAANLEKSVDTTKLDTNVSNATGLDARTYANGTGTPAEGESETYTDSKLSFESGKRNRIYTGALEVVGTTATNSKGTLGVAVVDATVNNDYTASINKSNITLKGVDSNSDGKADKALTVNATSDSYVAGFAVGTAVSTTQTSLLEGAGSVAKSSLDNDLAATVTDSVIKSNINSISASTTGKNVGVAGSLGYSNSKVGVGLAVAVNILDNSTKAGLYGGSLAGLTDGDTTSLTLTADNTGKQLALALGLSVANDTDSNFSLQGNVAVNSGKNDTVAEVEKDAASNKGTTLTKASSIQVQATDSAIQKAAAAGLSVSGAKAGIGAGFAVNEIRGQTLAARLNNAVATLADNADIDVSTSEKMNLTTVGVGVGAAKNSVDAELTGAITKTTEKNNTAEIVGTTLTDSTKTADVKVAAKSNNTIISNADAITANLKNDSKATAGIAGSGLNLDSNTTARIKNSTVEARDAEVNANAVNKIYNVALGISGSVSTGNGAGSLGINTFTGNTSALIDSSTVKALNNVGVLSSSDNRLVNVTGGLSVGLKTTVGVGLSVAVNTFEDNVSASVLSSTIEAQGKGTKKLTAHRYEAGENNKLTTKDKTTSHRGLVVDAYSNHDTTNVVLTGGVTVNAGAGGAGGGGAAGGGAGLAVTLSGTGSRDKLSGSTKAIVDKSDVNKELDKDQRGDVVVTALEETDINTVDVNVGVSASSKLAGRVGASLAFTTLDRTVEAKITGAEADRQTVNAAKLIVNAGAKADADLVNIGIAVAGAAQGAGGGSALVDSVDSQYKVNAEISNVNGKNNGLDLNAAHHGDLSYTGVGVAVSGSGTASVGLGATVGMMKDNNTLTATLKNANLDHETLAPEAANTLTDKVAVTNYSHATPDLVSVLLSGAKYAAFSVGVVYDEHTANDLLQLNMVSANIGGSQAADTATLQVDNYYDLNKTTVGVNLAGAIASGSIGVTVQPVTINSSNVLNVTGSSIKADNISLLDKETRKIDLDGVNVNAGLEAAIGVTRTYVTLGGDLQAEYATTQSIPEAKFSLAGLTETINSGTNALDKTVSDNTDTIVKQADKSAKEAGGTGLSTGTKQSTPQAGTGTAKAEGQLLRVSNSTLTGQTVALDSTVTDDIKVYSATGGFAAVNVNVTAARVDETIKNKIDIAGSTLQADKLSVLSHITGKTYTHSVIGSVAGLTVNVGYADVYAEGSNAIAISGSTLATTDSTLVRALHDSTYETYTNGGNLAAATGSYTEAESTDSINNSVSITNNSALKNTANKTADTNTTSKTATVGTTGAIEVASIKESTAKTETKYGSVGGLQIGANSSTARVEGKATINLSDSKVTGTGTDGALDLYAYYNSIADVKMTYGAGSAIGGGGVAGHAASGTVDGAGNATGGAVITVSNNSLDLAAVSANALVGAGNALAKLETETYNINLAGSVGVNKLDATMATDSKVDFSNNIFVPGKNRRRVKTEYQTVDGVVTAVPVYEEQEEAQTDLTLNSETKGYVDGKAKGTDQSIIISVGHNRVATTTKENTSVSLTGKAGQETMLKSLTMNALGQNTVKNDVDGRTGSIILDISPNSATAKNTSTINTIAALQGKFTVAGAAKLNASQTDTLRLHINTDGSGLINANGGEVDNTRTGETAIRLTGAQLQAESASLQAHNDMSLNDSKTYAVQASEGVIFGGTQALLTNRITEAATVDIAGSSTVQTSGDLKLLADTKNQVYATGYGLGTGVADGMGIIIDSTLTYADTINVAGGSSLLTTTGEGKLSLSAVDDSTVQTGSYVYLPVGIVTVPRASTTNSTTRSNQINIGGTVDSSSKLKLYAGQYDAVAMAGLHAIIDAQTFSGGVIPPTSRSLSNNITENNTVIVGSSGKVRSVGDMDIYANEGTVLVREHSIGAYGWEFGADADKDKNCPAYVSLDTGGSGSASDIHLTQNNYVQINGTAEAGYNNKMKIEISAPNSLVVLDGTNRYYYNASNTTQAAAKPTISINGKTDRSAMTADERRVYDGITYGSLDIVNSLLENYNEQKRLLAEYSNSNEGESKSQAYLAIKASLAQTEAQLKQLGLTFTDAAGNDLKDEDGNIIVASTLKTDYLQLPDLSVSGGNITINTKKINNSTGTISAKGSPVAGIINSTNLYLKLGDVYVGEDGGKIVINKTTLDGSATTAQLNKTINSLLPGSSAALRSITAESSGAGSQLEVKNTFGLPTGYTVNVPGTEAGKPLVGSFMPDIELLSGKSITNESGSVTITNGKGNLLVNGNITASDITLQAQNGSIYQDTPDSLVNIGGEVKGDGTYNTPAASSGRISGSNIFISARAINVNGLIQSGFDKYTVNVDGDMQAKITALDNSYKSGKAAALSDDQIMTQGESSVYCISQGQMLYNTTKGYYDYQPAVYYNPSTQTVLVEEIVSSGGNIYLSGSLASTGNGRIYAMDGGADVTVTNASFTDTNGTQVKDIRLYGIMTSDVKGKVTMVDTKLGKETIITKGNYIVNNLAGVKQSEGTFSGSYSYTPASGQVYTWVTGTDTATRTYYQRKYEANWWGLRESKDVTSDIGHATKTATKELAATPKGEMTAIVDAPSGTATKTEGDYKEYTTAPETTSTTTSEATITRWETGCWGYRKHELYEWYVDEGKSTVTQHTVAASNPISVGFIGTGTGSISVTSDGSVDISGSIGSRSLNNSVSITSSMGSIDQERGRLLANNVSLSARGHMEGLAVSGGNEVNLTAKNTAAAGTTYYSKGVGTTISDGNAMNIDVNTQQKDGDYGKVVLQGVIGNSNNNIVRELNLTASGSIDQAAEGLISAAKITLNAENGSIGTIGTAGTPGKAIAVNTADSPLMANNSLSASLNAHAAGDINLMEKTGDLRLGTIVSDRGDVLLSGEGSLVDALPYESEAASGRSEEEQIALWQSLGLLDAKEIIKTDSEGNRLTTTSKTAYPVLENVETVENGKTVIKTQQKKDAGGNLLYYDTETTKWTADRLIYAISDTLINPHSGLQTSDKAPNISARNITLSMKDSAGLNSETTTEYIISELGKGDAGMAALKALAKADASSVVWDSTNDKVTVNQKLPVGIELKKLDDVQGQLTISAGQQGGTVDGNVYVEGRTEDKQLNDIQVASLTARGNVLLNNAYGGIYNAAGEAPVIKAQGLDINAGGATGAVGMLGTADNPLRLDITGPLRTTATKGLYLSQTTDNPLYVQNASSSGDLVLTAKNDILGYQLEGAETGYLRLEGNGTMTVESLNGNVGSATNYLRLLNMQDPEDWETAEPAQKVKITAENSIYIRGVTTAPGGDEAKGTIYLDGMTAKTGSINLDVNGNIYLSGSVSAAAINAKASLTMREKVERDASGAVTGGASLQTKSLTVQTGQGFKLESSNNELKYIYLYNAGTGTAGEKYDNRLSGKGLTSADWFIQDVGKAKETADELLDLLEGSLSLYNYDTDITTRGLVKTTADFTATAAQESIINEGAIWVGGEVSLTAAKDVWNKKTVLALGDINLVSLNEDKGSASEMHGIINATSLDSGAAVSKEDENNKLGSLTGTINAESKTNILNKYQWVGGEGVKMHAEELLVNMGNISLLSKGELTLSGDQVMYNQGQIVLPEGGDVTLESRYGIVGNMKYDTSSSSVVEGESSVVIYGNGSITVDAEKTVINQGAMGINGTGDISIVSRTGTIYNMDKASMGTMNGNVTLKAETENGYVSVKEGGVDRILTKDEYNKLTFDKTVAKYDNSAAIVTDVGSVYNSGDIVANNGKIVLEAVSGNVLNYDDFDWYENEKFDGKPGYTKDVATNSIVMSAAQGYLFNEHDIISDGDVKLTALTGLDSFGHNIYAQKDITLTATGGNLINRSVLESVEGNVTLTAQVGSVVNTKDIVALNGNVTLQADGTATPKSLTVTGVKTGGKTKTLTYDGGSVINSGDIVAHGTAEICTDTENEKYGKYVSSNGSITMSAKNGGVYNYDDFNTYSGTYGKDAVNGEGSYYYTAEKRASIISGAGVNKSYALSTNDIIMSAPDGELYTEKDYLIAGGNVDLTAKTGLQSFGKTIYAGGDISLRATEGNVYNNSELVSTGGNIHLISDRGSVVNMLDGNLMAFDGNVGLKAGATLTEAEAAWLNRTDDEDKWLAMTAEERQANGISEWMEKRVTLLETLTEEQKTALKATQGLKYVSYGRTDGGKTALEGTITDKTEGKVLTNHILLVDKYYKDGDNYKLIDQTTNVAALAGKDIYTVFSYQGEPDTTQSPLTAPGKTVLTIGTDLELAATSGDLPAITTITVNGQSVTAVQANLEGYRSNDALNRGDIVALGNLGAALTSKGGNAVNYDNFNYVDGKKEADKASELTQQSGTLNLSSTESITKPLTTGKKTILTTEGIELEGSEGYIYNSFNIETDGNMRMISGWDLTAGTNYSTTKVGGDWALVSMKGTVIDDSQLVDNKVGGNISMEGRKGVDARTSLTSENGSIWLTSLEGDVQTKNVTAENGMVVIGSHDSNISLGQEITGKNVILYAENGNITYTGGTEGRVNATEQLVISGKEVVLPAVSGGASNAVTAENYKAVHTGDTSYTGLQVKNAMVEVKDGTLSIDRLSVLGNAGFKAEGFDTSVFGMEGTYQTGYHATYYDVGGGTGGTNGSDSYKLGAVIGFNDLMDVESVKDRVSHMQTIIENVKTTITESKVKPTGFNSNNDGWMNLYIDDEHHQRSSGVLLDLDDYYYSGNQRLSLRDLCGKEDDFKPQAVFFDLMQPVTSRPRTFAPLSISRQSFGDVVAVEGEVRNAEADELIVSEE